MKKFCFVRAVVMSVKLLDTTHALLLDSETLVKLRIILNTTGNMFHL